MHFNTIFLGALASATALAAPAAELTERADPNWTILGLKRVCDASDKSCAWSFSVDTHLAAATACSFTIASQGGQPASQSPGNGASCGAYTVTSGWSGQFGPGNGFTTLSVVDYGKKKITWPAYTDKELANGAVVSPDKSYPVSNL
ncbi:hypothetical protein TruAng_003877 [Truncatella angustata]|nr:hypothetical protein TruAng_003877 [Truncatella angustata]